MYYTKPLALALLATPLFALDPAMFRGGPAHPGVYESTAPGLSALKWKFKTNGKIFSTPAVAGGLVYFGSSDHNLYAVRIADGSGLSVLDRVTAREIAGILEAAWNDPEVGPVLFASLPVAGVNGTLSGRMRRPPARGNVVAKTGTTGWASALSGYVRRRFVFSVLQNGNPVSWFWARRAQDRFATVLAATR